MAGLVGVLQALGATRQRDGSWTVDCAALQLGSLFGGDLHGQAVGVVAGEAITFKSPPELAACGKVWMTDVADEDAFCQALGVALDELREQVRAALQTLRKLGFKTRLQAPDPRPRGTLGRGDRIVGVVIDAGGDLLVDEIDGEALPTDKQASMMAPEEATSAELHALIDGVIASLAGLEATGVAAPPSLSREELRELQAALDDSEDGDADFDSDDEERTAAGVPPPAPRPARPGAHPAFDDDDDDEVEPPTATLTTPIARPLVAPPPAPRPEVVTRAVAVASSDDDDDDDPFDGIGEPTATRPVDLRATAVPPSDGGLMDALDDEEEVDVEVDIDAVDEAFVASPTAVAPHAAPAVPAPAQPAIADDDDFEESTAALPHGDEDFDDGKTRALVVDEALLARLKRGDDPEKVTAAPHVAAPPSRPPATASPSWPVGPTLPLPPAAPGDDDTAGFEAPATSATAHLRAETRGEHEDAAPAVTAAADDGSNLASAFDDDFDDGPAGDPSGFDSQDDVAADDDITVAPPARPTPTPPATPPIASPFDDDDVAADDELAHLEARAAMLEAELATVRARIAMLRRSVEPTGTTTAPTPAMATTAPPPPLAEQPRVGDSDEGEVETVGQGGGLTSLPSLQSVDVHEVNASRLARPAASSGNSLLDELDESDDEAGAFDGQGVADPVAATGDEDVVSLAALQGALKELGVIGEGGGETQVAASVMNFAPADDDGDVFGSGGDSLAEAGPSGGGDLSVEATRIRTSRPSSIALVVEDERARDRLKKHLADRFSALIEAADGESAMGLRGIADVDAIVFVRPRRDGGTLASFTRLEHLPQRPRVLVISADDGFDDVPAVDLRLPLGQRASEVARQVLDGLEQLGVPMMPAA
jgi:hypothetical protein